MIGNDNEPSGMPADQQQPQPTFADNWRAIRSNTGTIVEYVLADNARSKRSFTVGLLTVYIVVVFLM